jgi:hypothetical protein
MNILTKYEPYSGKIFNSDDEHVSIKSIFVSIVSYRDKSIINTINSLFANAKRPSNIFLSICATEFRAYGEEWINELELIRSNMKNNITLNVVECNNKTTIGELKKIADSEYNKENYYMSISPRSEFDPHWDEILIKQYDMIQSNITDPVVITVDPRRYLYHDDVVEGFVYFTNHKTRVSMQREDYDGARVPSSGYNYFVNDSNIESDSSFEGIGENLYENMFEKNQVEQDEEYLSFNGFPKFSSRKFTKDEYISVATGYSSKFVFSNAKVFLKNNKSNKVLIDDNHLNLFSLINLLKSNCFLLSIRSVPVYQLFSSASPEIPPEKTPYDLYDAEEYKHSEGNDLINRLLQDSVYTSDVLNNILSIDWEKKIFKKRTNLIKNNFLDSINFFISFYNFSTYENSLHWNKKC